MCVGGRYACGGCPEEEPEITKDNWPRYEGAYYPCEGECEKTIEPCEGFEQDEEDEDSTICQDCGHLKECHEE